jgi:hypothetical protein
MNKNIFAALVRMHGGAARRRFACLQRLLALATSAFLIAAGLAACTHSTPAPSAPGVAPTIGPAPTASLPAGEKTTIQVTATSNQPLTKANDLLAGSDKQIGPAYDFLVGKEPSSALITFKVDPSRLASAVGVKNASPAGLYIQIYEPALRSWVPLKSTYHRAAQTVTATAPHLSLVSLSWTDVTCLVIGPICTAALFAKVTKHFTSDIVSNIRELFPGQEDDECDSKGDQAWVVKSSITKLSGCVISSETPPEVRVQNPLLFPMVVRQPQGAPHASLGQQPYMTSGPPELSTFLTELIDWATNATVIAPRSYGVIPVQELSSVGTLSMGTQPDAWAFTMDVVLSILAVLPGEKGEEEAVEQAVKNVLPEFEQELGAGKSFTLADILDAVAENKEQQEATAMGPVLEFVELLKDSYECVTQGISKVGIDIRNDGVGAGVIEAAGNLAEKCAESAYGLLSQQLSHSFTDVLDVLDAIPNLGKTIRESIQFAKLGPLSVSAVTIAQRMPYDLTESPFFQTPDRNIACGLPNFKWWPDQSTPQTAISQVDCRITKHTVAPTDCSTDQFEAAPGVRMEPSEYASFTCTGLDGDLPMYSIATSNGGLTPRTPYHAHNGQNINLGPVTCFVQTSSVDCSSNTSPYSFHLDPTSFRSPLIAGDSVLAAENAGGPNILAASGVVEPSTYPVGSDAILSGISWTEWDAGLAIGSASTLTFNTCQPACASGNYQKDHNVTVTFTDPNIVCGKWFFTELNIQDVDDPQLSSRRNIAPDTDAQGYCLPPSAG